MELDTLSPELVLVLPEELRLAAIRQLTATPIETSPTLAHRPRPEAVAEAAVRPQPPLLFQAFVYLLAVVASSAGYWLAAFALVAGITALLTGAS